jgi:hypothetical protein
MHSVRASSLRREPAAAIRPGDFAVPIPGCEVRNMLKKNLLGLEALETRETPSRGFGGALAGFTLPATQFVSGAVFADANGNGVRDAGENGVNGVRVYLDSNNNGARDAGEASAVTASSFSISFANGQTVSRESAGAYFFNAASGGKLSSGALRVELPEGAALTTAVPSAAASKTNPAFAIGLSGATGTPDKVTTGSTAIVGAPSGGAVSEPGRSSASVYAVSSVGANGQAFASVTGTATGNASVSATASATGANGTITSIFVN